MSSDEKNTIEARDICKYFAGVRALDHISFSAESGRVYAIVGENGAGKSTLLKIMNGDYQMTSGEILLNGEVQHYSTPKDAIDAGISIIYQERQIVGDMTVAENIFLGSWVLNKGKFVDFTTMAERTREVIKEFGLPIEADERVNKLSTAYQQMVEIMKAYVRDAKVIAFDEPTASLTDSEIDVLFRIIKKLKSEGKIIFYVSHRMKEIEEIADDVIVFKDGTLVACVKSSDVTSKDLVKMMVGRDLGDIFSSLPFNENLGDVVLEVENLTNAKVRDISFKVHSGEVLGFSGLVGAGRTEVMRSIFGVDPMSGGKIIVEGKQVTIHSPEDAIANGIALCPEDRKEQGIIPLLSVGSNISLSVLKSLQNKLRFINKGKESELIEEGIERFSINTPNADKKIVELSGGNQQKVIIARWNATKPKIMILDEPTKGIDVGAKAEFYKMIRDYATDGMAIILISSELPEIIGISDRIIVMREGEITGEIMRKDATEELLLQYAMLGGNK
ncbi:MAG: sugar ABC transporter ATP-binding protein [Oscillospiraceae bacterium]